MSPLTIGENDAADHLTFEPSCKADNTDRSLRKSDLTRPLIAAAGHQNDRVRLLDRVANGGKRMPNRCLRCEHADDPKSTASSSRLPSASSPNSNVEAGKSFPGGGSSFD